MQQATRRIRKKDDVIVERIDDDVLLTSRSSRKVHVLNESGGLLWDALDSYQSDTALKSLLIEARPDLPEKRVAEVVDEFVTQLVELGLVGEIGAETGTDT